MSVLTSPHSIEQGSRRQAFLLPLLVALPLLLATLATLDPAGQKPGLPEGPGLTIDEPFNAHTGLAMWRWAKSQGLAALHPSSLIDFFTGPQHLPDHPPLGRLLIGIGHDLTHSPTAAGPGLSLAAARIMPAICGALTVWLVGCFTIFWFGPLPGFVAALSLALMPRTFAHSHLAALETFVNLTMTACTLFVAHRWCGGPKPRWTDVLFAGFLFGLALLTKIQAVLLPVPLALWAISRWRLRGAVCITVWGLTGLAVFVIGWPWIWNDPITHLREYFLRATDRQVLYCHFLNVRYVDRDVPAIYPLVLFATTVPIGFHALAAHGLARDVRRYLTDGRPQLVAAVLLFPLVFFALPGITVYDGERLFSFIYPLEAVLIGLGTAHFVPWLQAKIGRRPALITLVLLLVGQSYGILALHPCQLSYYNLLTGGLRGANRLGFERSYWGDSITRSFLQSVAQQVPEGKIVHVAPVLHALQLTEIENQSPILQQRGITLAAYDDRLGEQMTYVIVFRRMADPWPLLKEPVAKAELLAEVRREGVQLAALYRLKK